MSNETETDLSRQLIILEHVENDPDVTQASLAAKLGVAVGTVNWHIKRLVEKGFIKVKRAQRKKLRYIITPEGISFRARLTVNYIENSMRLYRRTRQRVGELLKQAKEAGYDRIYIMGDGDIADICKLTCLEHGIKALDYTLDNPKSGSRPVPGSFGSGRAGISPETEIPILEIHGMKVILKMERLQSEEDRSKNISQTVLT